MSQAYLDPTVLPRLRRLALASVTCPDCWSRGTLAETVPPCAVHIGYFQCSACPWYGSGKQLEVPPDEDQHQAVLDVMREDQRRGQKGGSSSSGRIKEDKLRGTSLRRLTHGFGEFGEYSLREAKIEAADSWLSVRNLPEGCTSADVLTAIQAKIEEDWMNDHLTI